MKNDKSYINLNNIFEKIGVVPGDKLLVSSNILKILIKLKKKDKVFNANLIIDLLINKVGKNGTLMFPTYNWDFCKGKDFDYNNTKSLSGSLSNTALKRKEFKRTKNPIYSYAVTGKDKEYICNLNHESCFNLDSPFGYLIKNKGKNLFIDLDYKDGFTLCHVAEESIGVDYRYFKNFSGFYIDKVNRKKKVNYKMYVRNLKSKISMTAIDKKFDQILITQKAYEKKIVDGISLILIDINKAYKSMLQDIKLKGGLIYPKEKNEVNV